MAKKGVRANGDFDINKLAADLVKHWSENDDPRIRSSWLDGSVDISDVATSLRAMVESGDLRKNLLKAAASADARVALAVEAIKVVSEIRTGASTTDWGSLIADFARR